MNLPENRGPRLPKRHPACPGKRQCKLPSCIHNAPVLSTVSADDNIPVDLFEANGMNTDGSSPSVTCFRDGSSYQQLEAASELGTGDRKLGDETMSTVGTKKFFVQRKIREVSRNMLDRIRSCFC